jgi:hypothetical protein
VRAQGNVLLIPRAAWEGHLSGSELPAEGVCKEKYGTFRRKVGSGFSLCTPVLAVGLGGVGYLNKGASQGPI